MEIYFNNKLQFIVSGVLTQAQINKSICEYIGLNNTDYYLLHNGKRVEAGQIISGRVHVILRTVGGKGGFGSMLRAIGAQIEKTTNREACRDLSGRRLRDINEEQRLKNWINQEAEREKEAKERKKKKLERLCEKPKHEFNDAEYDKERSELPEKVEDAVLQGLQASCSTKRKTGEEKEAVKKKKAKLWVDDELDEDLSSSDDESNVEGSDKTDKDLEVKNSNSLESSSSNRETEKATNPTSEAGEKGSTEDEQDNKTLRAAATGIEVQSEQGTVR